MKVEVEHTEGSPFYYVIIMIGGTKFVATELYPGYKVPFFNYMDGKAVAQKLADILNKYLED